MDHKIKRVFIEGTGDPDVGILPCSVTIEADGEFLMDLGIFDPDDAKDALEEFRVDLGRTFGAMWDDKVFVRFDFEVPE